MNPTVVKAIIFFVCLLVWVLQIVALADPTGYIKVESPALEILHYKCGLFECNKGDCNLRDCLGDEDDQLMVRVSCAFAILALILMTVQLIIHGLLIPAKCLGKLMQIKAMSMLVKFFWVFHLITAIFLIVSWALLAALYDDRYADIADLQHGFVFLIINTVFELVLAAACFKHLHSEGPMILKNKAPPPPPAYPHHERPNPIEREGFPSRNFR